MKKLMIFFFMIILTLTLFSQTKANVKMLNGDTIPCEIETARLDLVTDYGELSFGTKFIKTIQFPEPGKGNTVLNTIFGETFRGFITNDIIELNVYGSLMKVRKAKINNIEFLNENQQATDYTIVISLRNGDTFYATPVDSIINIQTSYGEVKLPFENMAAISFEGFGNVLTRIEMKDGGIMQGIIKDDYIPVNLLSEIELEVVPDLMKKISFVESKNNKETSETNLHNDKTNTKRIERTVQLLSNPNETDVLKHTGMKMVLVEKGQFSMGNTRKDSFGQHDEKPIQVVKLTYDFYIGQYEITFDDYELYCTEEEKNLPNDQDWGRGERPVINISWWDTIQYCNWLSKKEGFATAYDNSGNLLDKNGRLTTDITEVEGYRLPTEAEWEYAARGGRKSTKDFLYSGSDDIDDVAWYDGNIRKQKTQPVGLKQPNELGLYDMSGNVREWCHDSFGYYTNQELINPTGPKGSYDMLRITRGGCFRQEFKDCRISDRGNISSNVKLDFAGFRIARTKGDF